MPRHYSGRKRVCSARMEVIEVRMAEPEEAEIMELMQDVEPPKMIQPKKPKRQEQRLPGVKLLRRINKDRDDELLRRREEALNRREEAIRQREEQAAQEILNERENNIMHDDEEPSFLTKLRELRLERGL